MEGFNLFKKNSKSESILGKISKVAKFATLGTGLAIGANNLDAQEIHQNTDGGVRPELEKNINIEDEKSKPINGGNIEEVIVYSKSKYVDELKNLQEKYLADMAKYKQDSIEWVKANQAYQDSLGLYNQALTDIQTGKGHPTQTLSEARRYGKRDYEHLMSGKAYLNDWVDDLAVQALPVKGERFDDMFSKQSKDRLVKEYTKNGNKPTYLFGGGESLALPLYKNPTTKPISPLKPNFKPTIKYDPKYEHLIMHPIWASKAKADTSAIIGTINPLQHSMDYDKGFTIGEAMRTFPPEVLKDKKIDYIYDQAKEMQRMRDLADSTRRAFYNKDKIK